MSKDLPRTDATQTGVARAMQLADTKRIAAYLLQRIREEKDISSEVAERLAKRIAGRIKRVVVWDAGHDTPEQRAPAVKDQSHTDTVPAAVPSATPLPPKAIDASAAAVREARVNTPSNTSSPAPAASEANASSGASAPFDPYAFSVVVVLTKTGKDGLMKKLTHIERPEHLRKLAEAQHLAVDTALSSAADLRAAIVKAAEQRIANRRAAAS
jgi:hypothetical protein